MRRRKKIRKGGRERPGAARSREGLAFFFFLIFIYLFIWLCRVFVAACGIFSCSMWDLVP